MGELDTIDVQLLNLLQHDGRMSNSELAQRVGLAAPTVLRRVKLLEERGYIRGYTVLLDPVLLGLTVTAFIFVELNAGCDIDAAARELAVYVEVQELHRVIGEWCFLLKVRTANPQTLDDLVNRKLRYSQYVRRTFTTLVTVTPFETTHLALPNLIEQTELVS
jgi:Lrp/AsnC family leucine-responsive transcriptional regulator